MHVATSLNALPLLPATPPSTSSLAAATPEDLLQSLFTTILNQQGREGYQSAVPFQSSSNLTPDAETSTEAVADQLTTGSDSTEGNTQALANEISAPWQTWFRSVQNERYSSLRQPTETADDFQVILEDAYRTQAYHAPQAYVQNLSKTQLATLQAIHHLADPINASQLTEEGAINLLLPPAAQIDLNHDGLTQNGKAYGIRFPDSRTPSEVVAAWDLATAGMDTGEKMVHELRMKTPVLFANIHVSADGQTVTVTEPGDPDFRNPQADPDYSYQDFAKASIESTEYLKLQMSRDQYERDMQFWTSMLNALQQFGAS